MANEIQTRFSNVGIENSIRQVSDLKRAYESLPDQKKILFQISPLESAIRDIQNYNKAVDSVKNPSSKSAPTNDAAMQRALADIKRYQNQQIQFEKKLTDQIEKEAEQQYRVKVRSFQRSTEQALKEIRRIETEENKIANTVKNKSIGGGLTSGFGTSIGIGASLATAAYALEEAIKRSKEASNANRALTSSATEAGKAYSVAAAEAQKFGKDALLSSTQANKSAAELQRLLTLAGEPNQFQKYSKGFLDVAAARGVEFKELDTLFQGIISGSDDALNRFGKQDPSKLAEQYAKKIGKANAEALTEQEKILSRLDAFEKDFKLFEGANADRIGSVSGQSDQAAQSIDNLKTNLSLATTQSLEFHDALTAVNQGLQLIAGFDPIDIRIRLQQGETPEKLAEEAANSYSSTAIDHIKALLTGGAAVAAFGYDLLSGESFTDSYNRFNYATSPELVNERRKQEYLNKFTKEKNLLDRQKDLAEQQRLQQSSDKYLGWQKQQVEAFRIGEKERIKVAADAAKEEARIFEERKKAFKSVQESALSLFELKTGNTLVRTVYEGTKAIEDFKETFKDASADAVANFTKITNEAARTKLAIQTLENRNEARRLRNDAFSLGGLLPSEINGTQRRLGLLENSINSIIQSQDLRRNAGLDRRLATASNENEINRIRQSENILQPLEDFNKTVQNTLLRQSGQYLGRTIEGLYPSDRFSNLGIFGQEKIAQARLSLLPSQQELVQLIQSGAPNAGQAREALNLRAGFQETIAQASEQRLKDSLFKDDYLQQELARKSIQANDALRDVALGKSGVPLGARLDNALQIFDEIGTENLDPQQLQDKINLLSQKAALKDKQSQTIDEVMNLLKGAIKNNRLMVGIDEPIVDLTIQEGRFSVGANSRPAGSMVRKTR